MCVCVCVCVCVLGEGDLNSDNRRNGWKYGSMDRGVRVSQTGTRQNVRQGNDMGRHVDRSGRWIGQASTQVD